MEMTRNIDEIATAVHACAVLHGFHPTDEPLSHYVANQCNNLHAEVSELWDAFRSGTENDFCDKASKMIALGLPALTCQEEELADLIIRALDISCHLNIDILRAIQAKHEYNLTRPYKHGKKN
jgi:NTP pyrophosphatase (non-canonical NTP hydrolase)